MHPQCAKAQISDDADERVRVSERLKHAAHEMLAALKYIAQFPDVSIASNPTPIRKRALAAVLLVEPEWKGGAK